jgi:hypothetical protein
MASGAFAIAKVLNTSYRRYDWTIIIFTKHGFLLPFYPTNFVILLT